MHKSRESRADRDKGMFDGRGERIRTSGLHVPNVALYQAKLHPDLNSAAIHIAIATGIAASCQPHRMCVTWHALLRISEFPVNREGRQF